MEQTRDWHSSNVRIVKLVCFICAVLAIGAIFLSSNLKKISVGLLLSDSQIAELVVGQKVTNPHFSGITQDGNAFSISADAALPDAPKPNTIDLTAPRMVLEFDNGTQVISNASEGALNIRDRMADFSGDVFFSTTDGYFAQTQRLELDFKSGIAVSPNKIHAESPFGKIDAGSMRLFQDDTPERSSGVLLFQNGVKLIYTPQSD